MPSAPARHCPHGHPPFIGARCPACRATHQAKVDAARPPAHRRGYDSAWRACRRLFLAAHPDCCAPDCDRPATDVDHVLSVRDRPDLRLSWSNLRPFCHAHHSQRTAREQSFGRMRHS